jgi:hypothetical protein
MLLTCDQETEMPIVAFFEFPGEPIENYDRGLERDGDAKRNQPERISHICFETEDGWAVIDVWESKEALQRFGRVLGLDQERQPRIFRVHNMM